MWHLTTGTWKSHSWPGNDWMRWWKSRNVLVTAERMHKSTVDLTDLTHNELYFIMCLEETLRYLNSLSKYYSNQHSGCLKWARLKTQQSKSIKNEVKHLEWFNITVTGGQTTIVTCYKMSNLVWCQQNNFTDKGSSVPQLKMECIFKQESTIVLIFNNY